MSKRMLISMPDGYVWQIPLEYIAACQMSNKVTEDFIASIMKDEVLSDIEKMKKLDTEVAKIVEISLADELALIRWGQENLVWADVVAYASIFST